jgi:hypothetical protein
MAENSGGTATQLAGGLRRQVANCEQRQAFWTSILRDAERPMDERLPARSRHDLNTRKRVELTEEAAASARREPDQRAEGGREDSPVNPVSFLLARRH